MPPKHDLFDFTSDVETPVGPSGIADELRREILAERLKLTVKLLKGQCKSMESYADAVGGIRQLDFVLDFAERKRISIEKSLGTPIEEED